MTAVNPPAAAHDDDGWVDIGHGVQILRYVQGDPEVVGGLLERHPCRTDDRHAGAIPFVPTGTWPTWQVVSWEPLTITPSVLCSTCGLHGWIRDGRWVPAG